MTSHPVPELHDVSPESWREANRRLLAKTLSEFAFEALIKPEALDGAADRYRVDLDSGVSYVFTAEQGALGGWRADKDSVTRGAAGLLGNEIATPAWDVQQFLVDCADTIGTDSPTLGMYLTELSATLAVDAARIEHGGATAAELRELGHAELECHMTGHPTLVANKGRVGFSATDVRAYAPESQQLVKLQWIAVHRGLAEFRGTSELSEQTVNEHELSAAEIAAFRKVIEAKGGDPDAYVWMPVHPWQWDHAVQVLYAGEVAQNRIIPLGESKDGYLPQQSVRTMTNMAERGRYDVKLPLKIVNTLIWRGIPPHCTQGAPVTTQWLTGLLDKDPVLRDELRTVFLGEIASVTVRHPYLDRVPMMPYQHLEALGCIWRTSVSSRKDENERVRTFASLLHVDENGTSFAAELARTSGLPAEEWLARLFETVLHPVLHVMYTYGITFNPHGQNTMIGYDENDVPRRLFLKDFVDDVSVTHTPVPERGPEPDGYDHVLPRKNPVVIRQHVVDQLLLGHFRYLEPLVVEQLGVTGEKFWQLVRDAVVAYHKRFPEKADRFAEFDMLDTEFPRYPFNTDRLVITKYVDRALRHALRPNGTVPNPLAEGR